MIRFEMEGGREMASVGRRGQSESFGSLRQQCAGFFGTLDAWLTQGTKDRATYLDTLTEEMIAQRINDALRGSVRKIEVVVERLPNRVERFVSAVVRRGVPHIPAGTRTLDLDDVMVREFLFAGAERKGFDIPVDSEIDGYVWDDAGETHIHAWLK
ncbi:hypothetical protein [Paraburkholderia sacchari]|uniref:hypothetical protein n=1 Tax=Paraburkholderia sacchari TaxID=159450 RepID=UPI000541BD85|nr:hypothetical protein [Paraburkholderia sacchari]NLP64211.1 hypothetical protein [Paraburkholderia sacchari]